MCDFNAETGTVTFDNEGELNALMSLLGAVTPDEYDADTYANDFPEPVSVDEHADEDDDLTPEEIDALMAIFGALSAPSDDRQPVA
jgi:hypothetical protein